MQKLLKIILIKGAILFAPFISYAQHWAAAGDSCQVGSIGVACLYEDTIMNRVYCGGSFANVGCPYGYTPGNIMPCYDFAYYNGTSWFAQGDTFPMGYEQRKVVRYNGDLFGNVFNATYNSNSNTTYIGKWYGTFWERHDTVMGGVNTFYVYNKRLYVFGEFTKINNIVAHNVAYKDSVGWHAIDTTSWTNNNEFSCGAIYNGDLYVAGSFSSWDGSIQNFASWDGSQWHNVGGNLFNGSLEFIEALCTYNGYLYVGGYFGNSNSLPGSSIARWDGTQWAKLGTGLTDSSGYHGQVHDMKIINGKLVIAGAFAFAAGLSAIAIVEWDGNQFCSFGGNFDNAIYGIARYNGEILISGPQHIYDTYTTNDTILACNTVGRWVGGNYREGCSGNVLNGISKLTKENNNYILYPNPNNGSFIIETNSSEQQAMQIFDLTGKMVLNQNINGKANIDASCLDNGVYFVKVKTKENIFTKKIIVQR